MNKRPVPEILLERFLLNELDARRMAEVREMIAADESLRMRVEGMKRSGSDIMADYPPEMMLPRIIERSKLITDRAAKSSPKKKPWYLMSTVRLVPAMAAAMLMVAVTIIGVLNYRSGELVPRPGVTETTRAKGLVPGLYLYRKRGGSVEVLRQGSTAAQNDLVQIAYMSAGDDHGIIFSVDGNGTVTLQYPDGPRSSTRIPAGKKVFVRSSYELDDAPGFEKFIFITSPQEIDVDMVLKNAQKIARGTASERAVFVLPGSGQRQYVFVLKKKETR